MDTNSPETPSERKKRAAGDWTRALREAAPYLGLGTTLASTVLLSLGAGYWVDEKLGSRPVFFLVGGAFGLFAAGYHFVKAVTSRRP